MKQKMFLTILMALAFTANVLAIPGEPCPLPDDPVLLMEMLWPLVDSDGNGSLTLEELQHFDPSLDISIFNTIDSNNDGLLTQGELLPFLTLVPNGLLSTVDQNGNGIIEYDEVSAYASPEQFSLVDINGDGILDCRDTLTLPVEGEPAEGEPGEGEPDLPCPLPPIYADELVHVLWPYMDRNTDGVLTMEEITAVYPQFEPAWFQMTDMNQDGVLDMDEVLIMLDMNTVLEDGSPTDPDVPADLVALVDQNGDRLIQLNEIAAYVTPEQFRILDHDNNRVLDCEDWEWLITSSPPPPVEGEPAEGEPGEGEPDLPCPLPPIYADELVHVLWPHVDRNTDGVLTMEEITVVYPQFEPAWFQMTDMNQDGVLDMDEVLIMLDMNTVLEDGSSTDPYAPANLVALVDQNG
ncbi:MAG: hypothetical protein KAH38_13280, partial [Candidatus Hydrogenedentes bacterium]|nr:hypothetical protein [Candidatus Hydrogenedentota bacterium]